MAAPTEGSYRTITLVNGQFVAATVQVEATGPITKVMSYLEDCGKVPLMILPHEEFSCAAVAKYEDRRFFLMYHPPKRRQVIWKNKFESNPDRQRRTFLVLWPHVYIGIFFRGGAIENGYAMLSKKKVSSRTSNLARLPFPNTSGMFGHVCEGVKGMWDIRANPPDTAVKYAKYFFESEYVSDINDHFGHLPQELRPGALQESVTKLQDNVAEAYNQEIFGIWQRLSELDPEAAFKIGWKEAFTISDLVNDVWRGQDGVDPGILGNLIAAG